MSRAPRFGRAAIRRLIGDVLSRGLAVQRIGKDHVLIIHRSGERLILAGTPRNEAANLHKRALWARRLDRKINDS